MSSKTDKQLKKLRQTRAGWRADDLRKLYEQYGFRIRSGTKHDIITHPDFPELRDMLPHSCGELAPDYARDALKSIEKVLSRLEKEPEDEEDDDE
ncbi:MAG: hypothetical protein MUE40_08035 [Anaerolineae bacterium]|jgi:hypothetical protein|nr:hypothetical protein [Anaerolineae bacterium]